MMKKAVKGAYAAKLQQHTIASGIIEAPAPVIQGEGERMVQGSGGDMSALTLSSSLPSTSHEADNGFLPIPVPVLAPVPAFPSSTGEEDGASTSLSLILTIPPSTSAPPPPPLLLLLLLPLPLHLVSVLLLAMMLTKHSAPSLQAVSTCTCAPLFTLLSNDRSAYTGIYLI
jgi:hypothetical protein